jgi:very-short-patch-repair endonuclease
VSSALEDTFAAQLDAYGLTGYVREYQAIPARKFRFDFAFVEARLLIEINGGTYSKGAHSTGIGLHRDYEKGNLAVKEGWRVLAFDVKQVKSGEAVSFTQSIIQQGAK